MRYSVGMQLTRRKLAIALLAPAAATAQTPAAPIDEVQAARNRTKANAAAIAKIDIAMATEPAFQFKA